MLRNTCILGVPQTKGDEVRIGCLTPDLSGAQKRAEMLCHSCILGTKSELAASPLPSRGARRGGKCYATPTFLGVPYKRGQDQNLLPRP